MQHDCDPKTLPRNVEIERRRRQYLKKNIKQCLDEIGVKNSDLIPAEIIQELYKKEDKFGLYSTINYLPLELFDDEEYDSRTPQGWMDHGLIDGVRHPMPGEAFLPVHEKQNRVFRDVEETLNYIYVWTDVAVTEYDPGTKLFSVITLDGFQRHYKVPRIYVMFKADDPVVFAQRVRSAVLFRRKCENHIKYEFYLDTMILTGSYEIEDDMLDRIKRLATRGGLVKVVGSDSLTKVRYFGRVAWIRNWMAFFKLFYCDPQQKTHFDRNSPAKNPLKFRFLKRKTKNASLWGGGLVSPSIFYFFLFITHFIYFVTHCRIVTWSRTETRVILFSRKSLMVIIKKSLWLYSWKMKLN